MKKTILALSLIAMSIGAASADTTLTGSANVDNEYVAYISTDDSVLGTVIGSGTDWQVNTNFSGSLTNGVTNYLHLVAVNLADGANGAGGPGGFLGSFSLSGTDFVFGNGGTTLLTGDTSLVQNTTGFGDAYFATVDEGVNGVGPWGFRAGYGADAPHWVWNHDSTQGETDSNTVYFSAAITAAVPEPESYAMLLGGLGLLAFMARRRKA